MNTLQLHGFPPIDTDTLIARLRIDDRLPDWRDGSGWEQVIGYRHPASDTSLAHREVIMREVIGIQVSRCLPLIVGNRTEQDDTVETAWLYYPGHPDEQVREETKKLADMLCR